MTTEQRPALYLEDLAIGDSWTTDEYIISAKEIVEFAAQFDPQVFHLYAGEAKDSFFGGLAASGWHTAALSMRLLVTSGIPLAGGLIGAGADVSWPTATRPGDVLHVESTIESIAPSVSRPDRGMTIVRSETLTAQGEVRQLLIARLMVFRRPQVTA